MHVCTHACACAQTHTHTHGLAVSVYMLFIEGTKKTNYLNFDLGGVCLQLLKFTLITHQSQWRMFLEKSEVDLRWLFFSSFLISSSVYMNMWLDSRWVQSCTLLLQPWSLLGLCFCSEFEAQAPSSPWWKPKGQGEAKWECPECPETTHICWI